MKNFITNSVGSLDFIAWTLVLLFFGGSARLSDGNTLLAFIGAIGIIIEMFLIAVAIEIIIECLKNTQGIGTITGFITNGPEAVCLFVGLLVGDIVFAASTPLGSNFMNPLLLLAAGIICRRTKKTFLTSKLYTLITIIGTASLAGVFFLLQPRYYFSWLLVCTVVSSVLFILRPKDYGTIVEEEYSFRPARWFVPAIVLLTVAGYYLDPVVSYTAEHSHAPKGVIGFFVLATLTSWPEFKSCLALLRREKYLAAILNITVSNITNIWLAAAGIACYLFMD
ncbi:MAG: sodium:proton exchanger [Desulforhopalus sp.]